MDLLFDCLLIVALRLADVSIGTVRIVLLTRGSRWRAGAMGFVEPLIWVFAVTLVLQNLNDPVRMVAYAVGFGLGTVLGVTVDSLSARSPVPGDRSPLRTAQRDSWCAVPTWTTRVTPTRLPRCM
jgi:uncharacterized protein YebE (UPF0316 family)